MPYQNNNNRVNPKEVISVDLNPQAAPVNNVIQYQIDKTITDRGNAVSDALIKLGQGLVDIEPVWKRQADEAALQNFHDEQGNAREWKDVSRNIKGFAMFNPYLKDAYKRLQAEEITRNAMIEISSNQNLSKLNNDEYRQYISNVSQNIYKQMEEKGLSQKDYSLSMTGFNEFLKNTDKTYYIQNSKYQYDLYKRAKISELSRKLSLADNENFIDSFNVIIKDSIEDISNYVPDDEIAEMVWNSVVNYIGNYSENINEVKLAVALNNIDVNGKRIEDFRPDYQADIRKLITEAQYASYQRKLRGYQEKQLNLKIQTEAAETELFNTLKMNPEADFDSQWEAIQTIQEKYNLGGQEGFSLLNTLISSKNAFYSLKQIKSNPETEAYLIQKLNNGTLTKQDINEALINKELSPHDALQLNNTLTNDYKKYSDSVLKTGTTYSKSLANKNSELSQRIENAGFNREEFTKQFTPMLQDLHNSYDDGLISAEEYNKQFSAIKNMITTTLQEKEKLNRCNKTQLNANVLLNGNYVRLQRSQVPEKFKRESTDKKQIQRMFWDVLPFGFNTNMQITALPTENRSGKYHGGYDLGLSEGTNIRIPMKKDKNITCTFVRAGFEPNGFGNYAVLSYSDGTFVRLGHMQQDISKNFKAGQVIHPYTVIGQVGNTGRSTGSHLHVDFWKQGKGLIPVSEFYK